MNADKAPKEIGSGVFPPGLSGLLEVVERGLPADHRRSFNGAVMTLRVAEDDEKPRAPLKTRCRQSVHWYPPVKADCQSAAG
jgi:hypothetical protein